MKTLTTKLFLFSLFTASTLVFGLTPDQQRAFDLVDQLSSRVFTTLSLPSPQAKQAEFCSMAQAIDVDKAAELLVQSWADRYGKDAAAQSAKDQHIASFKALLPAVIANDMLSLFDTLNLVGGQYVIDQRPIAKGSRAVGVKVTYYDAAGKSYDITFVVNIANASAKLIDAQTSVASLVGSKQTDYDKRMRDVYSKGLTGQPIGALNQQLESELSFRCN